MGSVAGRLTVAVTGATGTFGFGLLPWLQRDDRVARVVAIARHGVDPGLYGWTKATFRRADVRDADALAAACAGADVVVHLAFAVTGGAPRATLAAINVDGTRTALQVAAAVGARRFVYPSSVAAYGFHRDNPVGMTEAWPVRPAASLFYARQKAEVEQVLAEEGARYPDLARYVLRPSIVVGQHTLGAKASLWRRIPGVAAVASVAGGVVHRVPLPVPAPALPLQLVHEQDVGQALLQCVVAAGPPGEYNIAGDGTVTLADLARAAGLVPVPVPVGATRAAARALAVLARAPVLPPAVGWVEALAQPAIMDTGLARSRLGWVPRYTAADALRAAFRRS